MKKGDAKILHSEWEKRMKRESEKFWLKIQKELITEPRVGRTLRRKKMRDLSRQRCMMCGSFMIPNKEGQLYCKQCGCCVSETDWWEND